MQDAKRLLKEKSWVILLFAIFIFSFLLDMYILTRYNLSYGRDGPFYDLQVLNIMQTGFTSSNDPPLAYYMLTPFVMITGNSFLGIKIGMSLIGSLMVFPAFFLTQMFTKKINTESKIPALLSAFLMTVNPFYFGMIGDFMQNLVGVFFLLLLLYSTVKWLENTNEWKKYGILTIILLLCSIFTHIFTGILAVGLFLSLLILNFAFKTYKSGKMHFFDVKIGLILGVLIVGGLSILFAVYPLMFSKFTTVLSFLNTSSSETSSFGVGAFSSPTLFLTLPLILGIIVAIKTVIKGLKKKNDPGSQLINKKTLLTCAYLIMTVVLIFLSTSSSIDSQYRSRFIMLLFVPIALLVPLGLKFIENWISKKYPSKKVLKMTVITTLAVLFAMSAFYTASGEFSSMGPSISAEQYNELVQMKEKLDTNGIVVVGDYHTGYWVQYVLGRDVETGNVTEVQEKYPDKTIYAISLTENMQIGLKGDFQYTWNPLFPYSFPWGGLTLDNSQSGQNSFSDHSNGDFKSNRTAPPSNGLRNATMFNRSASPPSGNFTRPDGSRMSENSPDSNIPDNSNKNDLNQDYSSYGTLILSENNIKVYKIS